MEFFIGLNGPAFSFVYILMLGREEQVLVQHGSQNKRAVRPVWSVFPDYLSVPCDYGQMQLIQVFF